MKHRLFRLTVALLAVPFLVAGASAADPDYSKVEIKATKVAGSIYMLQGAGGNIGVCVGDDGIVIVDDQFAPLASKIKAALKDISDKPLKFVINTHFHGDHTGGNAEFGKEATVIAHENVRKRLKEGGTVLGGEVKAAPKEALPIVTFNDRTAVHINDEEIRAIHFPHGHTDGDSVIFFTHANVVHMGDDFVTYGFPFIDVSSGGSIDGMIDGVEKAIAQLPADVKVIPGHGPVSNLDDVRTYIKMLKDTRETVKAALKQKKTLDQMKKEKILDPWKKYSGDFISEDAYLETLYNSLTGSKEGKFIPHN